jgi:N-acetylglucosamine kinase-like BadF-type ATPase
MTRSSAPKPLTSKMSFLPEWGGVLQRPHYGVKHPFLATKVNTTEPAVAHYRRMAFYLGIDGGGTSTRCVVGDEHRVLGSATTSSAKIARVGAVRAREALQSAIRDACSAAKISPQKVSQSCIGMAGVSRPDVVNNVRSWAAEVVAGKIEVVGDMVVALEAAFGGAPGVTVIAGTGSICYGRNQRGETARTGGGGPGVSDEGSGDWIGRRAAHEASRAVNAGKQSPLLKAFTEVLRIRAADLKRQLNADPPPDFAALFPSVQKAADAGDPAASEILRAAGEELAKLAAALIRQLWPQPQSVLLAMSGGVLENSALVRGTFVTRLRADLKPDGHEIAVSFGLAEPVMGALSLARKGASASAKQGSA